MNGLVQPASPVSVGSVAQLALSLAAIVALILAVSWVLKRLKLGTVRGRGEIAVIDQLSLGPRERIVLVRVGEAQVLVGVGSAGLVELTPLATPIAIKSAITSEFIIMLPTGSRVEPLVPTKMVW